MLMQSQDRQAVPQMSRLLAIIHCWSRMDILRPRYLQGLERKEKRPMIRAQMENLQRAGGPQAGGYRKVSEPQQATMLCSRNHIHLTGTAQSASPLSIVSRCPILDLLVPLDPGLC